MKVDKRIREMPWPSPWKGTNEKICFRVNVEQPVVEGNRLLVVTFCRNRNHKDMPWAREVVGEDFRLVCCKAKGKEDAVVITEKGRGAARKRLDEVLGLWNTRAAYAHPEISEREENALCRWLGVSEKIRKGFSYNHAMPQLAQWVDGAMEAALQRERTGRGEIPDEDVGLCPEGLPEGLIDYIHRVILPEDNVLLYKNGNVRGTCFACGQKVKTTKEHKFIQGIHNRCPNCGKVVFCVREDSDCFSVDNVQPVATVQLGTDGETLFIRQWRILRPTEPQELREHTEQCLKEVARYAVRGRWAAKWQKEGKAAYYMRAWRYDMDRWTRMRNVAEVYDGSYYFFVPPTWREILSTTSLRTNKNMIRFCMDWARYPAIELLWKAGYKSLVNERVTGQTTTETRNAVRWTKKRLEEIFPFPLRLLREKKPNRWDLRKVAEVKKLWELVADGTIKEQDIRIVAGCQASLEKIRDALGHATARQVVKYVNKQYAMEEERREQERREADAQNRGYFQDGMQTGITYRDYLKECKKLGLDLDDKRVLFPPDLEVAHQRTSIAIKYTTSKKKEEKYQAAVKGLERMSWKKGELLIRPAATVRELIEEGVVLSHCVGGYAERVANKETTIFLIRRKTEPDKPYYTLELCEKRIVQCRTKNNRSYESDGEVFAFVEEWMETVVQKKTGRKNRNKEVNAA